MSGEQKMWCYITLCASIAISVVSVSVAYYQTTTSTEAIKAGLIQERNFGHVIWVKPHR